MCPEFSFKQIDIESWYETMPRSQKAEAMALAMKDQPEQKMSRIDQYYASSHCIVCRSITTNGGKRQEKKKLIIDILIVSLIAICQMCRTKPYETIYQLSSREQQAQDRYRKIMEICQTCTGISALDAMVVSKEEKYADIPCNSLDCPIFYERWKAKQDVKATSHYHDLIESIYN